MGDLARDWAGVLARWGGGAGAGQLKEAGPGPGTVLASYNRDPGQQHGNTASSLALGTDPDLLQPPARGQPRSRGRVW